MTILDISDIKRKENFIYYRREFKAHALIDLPGKKHTGAIEFTIETAPTGKKEISVTLLDTVDYPLIPIMRNLKEYILNLENAGSLP
ncbi:MAG TPA: hypothetical protein PLV73_10350 [Treponemataceae bacterium]|nr:MAG: hypothetical protein BWY20_00992 [Spirochaetes bacterium ADurb.Bin215]HOF85525.1 hypothetical protein [Treponemataceae bacterium]HOS35664.1 hypothetical protein [Treponemataceae bacterium]HOU38639.1 hypothetical protein [Treponemataceae bacterium]HPA11204.1 hypothetical protein [Treponemataceae bacterium]